MTERGAQLHAAAVMGLWVVGVIFGVCVAAGLAGLHVVRRHIALPVRDLSGAIGKLAERDYQTPVPALKQNDEFGTMAHTLEELRLGAAEAERLTVEQQRERVARDQRTARLEAVVERFEGTIGELVGQLAAGSTEEATAQSMTGTARLSNQQATSVTVAVEQASSGVQTVASAAEELSASINEISQQVAHSTKITGRRRMTRSAPVPSFAPLPRRRKRSATWWT